MMQRALTLAHRGEGRVEPNPMVGCVLVKSRRVIGEGYHRRFGGPHAEINAIGASAESVRGATLYATLEPCCVLRKTPPCTDALLEAGIQRVAIGAVDPNPDVNGKSVRLLRAAGMAVDVGILGDEATELIAPFATRMLRRRPYIIAKWAQSLDGKLATRSGHSKWISSEQSRREVHRLRARVDVILVGIGTVAADDPQLTAREVPIRRRAVRAVLDTHLRISERCRLVQTAGDIPTWVFTSKGNVDSRKAARLTEKGVEILGLPEKRNHVSLAACLAELFQRDVTNVLVEGGPGVLTALLEAGLVDEAHVFTAPCLIGGPNAPGAFGGRGASRVDLAIRARRVTTRRLGPDIHHHMRLSAPAEAARSGDPRDGSPSR